jgi:hypothetical protein
MTRQENHRQRLTLADEGLVQFQTGGTARHPHIEQKASARAGGAGHQEFRSGGINAHLMTCGTQKP